MVMGARQVGKSTLCEAIAASEQRQTVSLDDQAPRENAIADPAGFLLVFTARSSLMRSSVYPS
jgi:hypothetical protein